MRSGGMKEKQEKERKCSTLVKPGFRGVTDEWTHAGHFMYGLVDYFIEKQTAA